MYIISYPLDVRNSKWASDPHPARPADPTCSAGSPFFAIRAIIMSARKQLCSSFLLSDRKDVCMRISCLTVRQRPGHMSGRMAGHDLELPTGISVWWAGWDCLVGKGFVQQTQAWLLPVSSTGLCVLGLTSPWDVATARWDHAPWQRWTEWKPRCLSWGWCAHLECKRDSGAWKMTSWSQRGCRACNCRFQYSVISKENSLDHCST